MNVERKIQRLELAVLHLTQAVNDLLDAQGAQPVAAGLFETWRKPEDALRQARDNIEKAINSLSGER